MAYCVSLYSLGLLPLNGQHPLITVSHTLHCDDVLTVCRQKKLQPCGIPSSDFQPKKQVLWFIASQPMKQHSVHGNVSLVLDWDKVFQRFGQNLYLIDQEIDECHGSTRILLTANNYDGNLEKVQLESKGSPLQLNCGMYFHSTSWEISGITVPHELQIAVECKSNSEAKWFFKNCTLHVNDHSLANTPSTKELIHSTGGVAKFELNCIKYNVGLNLFCPYPYNQTRTENILKAKCPNLNISTNIYKKHHGNIEHRFHDFRMRFEPNHRIKNYGYDDHHKVTCKVKSSTACTCDVTTVPEENGKDEENDIDIEDIENTVTANVIADLEINEENSKEEIKNILSSTATDVLAHPDKEEKNGKEDENGKDEIDNSPSWWSLSYWTNTGGQNSNVLMYNSVVALVTALLTVIASLAPTLVLQVLLFFFMTFALLLSNPKFSVLIENFANVVSDLENE